MNVTALKQLIDEGQFHHATYRDHGTLWEGLWIYARAANGFRGFTPQGAFFKGSPELPAAEEIVRGMGTSVGSYGNG